MTKDYEHKAMTSNVSKGAHPQPDNGSRGASPGAAPRPATPPAGTPKAPSGESKG